MEINKYTRSKLITTEFTHLVGGFNPFEKYWSKLIISPGKGEKKIFETTT